jgi:nucleotide-binding universal stress UspA family protein
MRKILVAIDGSDSALRALDYAIKLAALSPRAELHVLTARLPVSAYTAWEIYVTAERIEEAVTGRARDVLTTAEQRMKAAGCTYALEILDGEPAEAITRRATELGCESIAMGTHGHGALGILFLGSVAQKVVSMATVPVTVVK